MQMAAATPQPGVPFDRLAGIETRLSHLQGSLEQITRELQEMHTDIRDLRRFAEGRLWWIWTTLTLLIIGTHFLK
jgi:hypothetical protein